MSIKLSGLSQEETDKILPTNTILLGYMGSISHGTHVPKEDPTSIDDIDIMGVNITHESTYLGLGYYYSTEEFKKTDELNKSKNNEQKVVQYKEYDSVVYEIRKFFKLLLQQNPNVLGLLWLEPHNYIYVSPVGKNIINNRSIFITKEAYHSFIGYAHDQLYKMEHMAFEGYMGEKRKNLVKQFGYDCKNAAHLIRLLRMGIEFLTDGDLKVFRKDNTELKEIKQGKWSLEKVKKESDSLFTLAREAYVRSELPPKPNYEMAEKLLISILKDNLFKK